MFDVSNSLGRNKSTTLDDRKWFWIIPSTKRSHIPIPLKGKVRKIGKTQKCRWFWFVQGGDNHSIFSALKSEKITAELSGKNRCAGSKHLHQKLGYQKGEQTDWKLRLAFQSIRFLSQSFQVATGDRNNNTCDAKLELQTLSKTMSLHPGKPRWDRRISKVWFKGNWCSKPLFFERSMCCSLSSVYIYIYIYRSIWIWTHHNIALQITA